MLGNNSQSHFANARPTLLAACIWAISLVTITVASDDRASAPRRFPRHTLRATNTWRLESVGKQRFDASGLLFLNDGSLLTVNDKGGSLVKIEFTNGNSAARLNPTALFTTEQVGKGCPLRTNVYVDGEGLASDQRGRLYLCEESGRTILRLDPVSKTVECLSIDWSPVRNYFSSDPNASFEGIAVSPTHIYVANERQLGRIIAVDLETLKVEDSFQVQPAGVNARDVQYSDLCWFNDSLWVLCRQSRCVLQVEIPSRRVRAQFDFGSIEMAPENAYFSGLPFGFVEGLAVDEKYLWLLVDNNGYARVAERSDTRPTLFQCPRPGNPPR